MSLASLRQKLDRLDADRGPKVDDSHARQVFRLEQEREQRQQAVAALIDFARELAGTRDLPTADSATGAVTETPPESGDPAGITRVDFRAPAPVRTPALDEKQQRAALIRSLRPKLRGYQLTGAEAWALCQKYPELNVAEDWVEPPPSPPSPCRNPWGLYAPSYASEETKAAVRSFGGIVDGDPEPDAEKGNKP